MTKEQLKNKTIELIEQAKDEMVKKIDHAIASGSMNVSGAEDNYFLPRELMVALLKDQYESNRNWLIQVHGKGVKYDIENIHIMMY